MIPILLDRADSDKDTFRSFLENRIVEIRDVSSHVLSVFSSTHSAVAVVRSKINKKLVVQAILALLVAATMVV